jgi:cell shape-determining protein MreC
MLRRQTLFFCIVIILLLVFIFFAPSYGWQIRNFLGPRGTSNDSVQALATQNEVLQAELAQYATVAAALPQVPAGTIRAMVYSRYPMNFKNEFLVNAGSENGVQVGHAVLFNGVLVGTVEKTFSNSALVMTVFDPRFKMPVRIGAGGIDGLLSGGTDPMATSIAKSAELAVGDIIYAAAPGISYAIPIGTVASVAPTPDNLFQEAPLNFAYDVNNVETVAIEP